MSKKYAYGVDDKAYRVCSPGAIFLPKATSKMGGFRSTRSTLRKGAPLGSVLGPFIFNCFQNDLLYSMTRHVDIFNYVDTIAP